MGEKTTIEIDNIRDLKQHALDTNKTLKQLINEAIMEKIQRERKQLGINDNQIETEPMEVKTEKVKVTKIDELKRILSNAGLLTIVEKECQRHNLNLNNLSPRTATPALIEDIHTAITLVFDDDTAEQIIKRIESLII
ncbi:hypothetical protein [[Eubacterium] cellulosolvens]